MANNQPYCFHFYTGSYTSSGALLINYEAFFCAQSAEIVSGANTYGAGTYYLQIDGDPYWQHLSGIAQNSTFRVGAYNGTTYFAVVEAGSGSQALSPQGAQGNCGTCSSSYNCTLGSCTALSDGSGTYATLSACQSGCQPLPVNYDCFNGGCTQNTNGTGIYSSLGACQAVCGGPTCSAGQLCATPSTICAGTCCTGGQSCADPGNICSGTCCPAGQSCYDPGTLTGLCQAQNACPTCPTCPTCPEDDVQFTTINAQIFQQCDSSGNPVYGSQSVSVIQGTEAAEALKFKELAEIYAYQNCNSDTDCAAIPLGWQIRPEYQRPQGIFQFAQIDNNGNYIGGPKYPITVPHLLNNQSLNALPNYIKGNWEIIYVLDDNSRVTIHSKDETNGMTVLTAIQQLIDPNYMTSAYISKSSLVTTQTQIAQNTVKNRLVKYYSQGNLNALPDWVVKWPAASS